MQTTTVIGRITGSFMKNGKNTIFWLMLLPSMFILFAIAYVPMFGIIVAFKEYNFRQGILFSPCNSFRNFEFLFKSGKLSLVAYHTVLYNIIFIAAGTIAAVAIAIMISEAGGKYFKKLTQSVICLPNFISWVIISTILYNLLNIDYGAVNTFVKSMGGKPFDVYTNPNIWYILLPALKIWKGSGFGSVIYFAAIMGIDQECYESADLDGANIFQKVRYITLPMLVPTIIILTLLSLGGIMRGDFDMFYQLVGTNGLLFNTTDIIDTYVFRSLVSTHDIGMASAAGFFQSILCFLFIILVNKIVKLVEPEYSLF